MSQLTETQIADILDGERGVRGARHVRQWHHMTHGVTEQRDEQAARVSGRQRADK